MQVLKTSSDIAHNFAKLCFGQLLVRLLALKCLQTLAAQFHTQEYLVALRPSGVIANYIRVFQLCHKSYFFLALMIQSHLLKCVILVIKCINYVLHTAILTRPEHFSRFKSALQTHYETRLLFDLHRRLYTKDLAFTPSVVTRLTV